MRRERRLPGCLGALVCSLPAAPLARLLLESGSFTGIAGLVGFLLALGGYRLLARRCSGLGVCIAALLAPLAALPGLYYGCAALILRDNARFGCTMAEALELVPVVALDPINRGELRWALGSVVFLDLLTAALTARYLALRRQEGIRQSERDETST